MDRDSTRDRNQTELNYLICKTGWEILIEGAKNGDEDAINLLRQTAEEIPDALERLKHTPLPPEFARRLDCVLRRPKRNFPK
jgi:hypothetical protein